MITNNITNEPQSTLSSHNEQKRSLWCDASRIRAVVASGRECRNAEGYVLVALREHPRANGVTGYVKKHVLIAELAFGGPLPNGVEIHHLDNDGGNNANTNLVICQDRAYHFLLHKRQNILAVGGDPNTQLRCYTCNKPKPFAEFDKTKSGDYCRECTRARILKWHRRKAVERHAQKEREQLVLPEVL